MDYGLAYIQDQMIALKAKNLRQWDGTTWSFPDTGNTFQVYYAKPYADSILFAPDIPTFRQLAEHYEINDGDDFQGVGGRMMSNGRGLIVVGVFDGRKSTLVHETGHAALRVLYRAGLNTNVSNDEAFCYLQTSMFEAFEGFI